MKILIADSIAQEGKDVLEAESGIDYDFRPDVSPEELLEIAGNYDGIIVRSRTKITSDVIDRASKLKAVARAGVGIDNVDVAAASRKGVIVMNTPGGNTLSTAEHTIALMMALARNLPRACEDVRAGNWNRKQFMGSQLAGKTLAVIGLGRIGAEVAKRAVAMKMKVIGLDPFLSEEKAKMLGISLIDELDEALACSDYLTVHTPLTDKTRDLISTREFGLMKKEARVINCARGGIINEDALCEALKAGTIAGAAIDVYMEEPPMNRELVELDNVVATPHLGASTKEAQVNVAVDAAKQLVDALLHGIVRFAVNMPALEGAHMEVLAPYVALAEKIGTFHMQIAQGRISVIEVICSGEMTELPIAPITTSVLMGLLSGCTEDCVNAINARLLAEERGISVSEKKVSHDADYTNLISVSVTSSNGERRISGTIVGKADARIVGIDDYRTDISPFGNLILVFAQDKPGLIGRVGEDLGENGINIAGMTFARREVGGEAICVLNLDDSAPKAALSQLGSMDGITSIHVVNL